MALMGTVIGIVLGLGAQLHDGEGAGQPGHHRVRRADPRAWSSWCSFGAGLGVLASVRPALKAAKLNVLEAIATE